MRLRATRRHYTAVLWRLTLVPSCTPPHSIALPHTPSLLRDIAPFREPLGDPREEIARALGPSQRSHDSNHGQPQGPATPPAAIPHEP